MRGRIGPGIAGWLAAMVPLIIANLATFLGYLSFDESVLAGTLGLLGSIVLGGLVAGILGGRDGGGARGALVSGGASAVLYSVSVIGLNAVASIAESSSPQILYNPVLACMTVLFCASLLLGVALIAGAVAGSNTASRHPPTSAQPPRMPPMPVYGSEGRPSQYLRPPAPRAAPPTTPRRDWPPYGDDPRAPYDGYDDDARLRAQSRRPADVMSRPSGYRQDGSGQDRYDRSGDRRS